MAMKCRYFRQCKAGKRIYDLQFSIYDWHCFIHRRSRITRSLAVKRLLTITTQPIDEAALLGERKISSGMGAVIYFLGVVRGSEENQVISAIEYEAFEKMAEHQFHLLFDEIEKRWPVESARL